MRKMRPGPVFWALCGCLVLAAAAVPVFFLRAPVVLVSDAAFDLVYGPRRLSAGRARASLHLFRRVVPVSISEDAGMEVNIFAIESAAARPHCVLFPFRYHREGSRYAEGHPGVPVGVLAGRRAFASSPEGLVVVATDVAADMFRAGRVLAVLAGPGSAAGRVLVLYDEYPDASLQGVFAEGLRAGGFAGNVVWSGSDQFADGGIAFQAALVFSAPEHIALPSALFSWADPERSPEYVRVVFDDSPPALAAAAVPVVAGRRGNGKIPSVPLVLRRRSPIKEQRKRLDEAVSAFPPGDVF